MAYQAKRNKRFEEDFELVDENGVVQHTLKVSLDADDMVAKINRKYTALVRALSDVQAIKRKEASNEQLSDAVEMLGRAEIDMFEAVFGADGTETIQQFYKDHYIEMAKEVIPFITGVVIPRLTEIKAENKKALVSQYNRAKKETEILVMGVLTELPSYRICTDKGRFDINPAFDIILEVQRLYKEESLTDYEKIQQALSMLVRNRWNLRLLNPAEQLKLMQDITSRYIEVEKRPQIKKSPVPVLDFERDGDYIYASFMQAYQIDLIDEQGKLPWKKFLYLFNGLPADTKIKQIMRIRQMPVPEYNGKNSKEIQEINEMKSYYALPVQGGGGQSGLDLLFHTLEGMAKR